MILSQLAMVGMVVFDLLIPQAIQGIVNNGILRGDMDWVLRGGLYMAIFAVCSASGRPSAPAETDRIDERIDACGKRKPNW